MQVDFWGKQHRILQTQNLDKLDGLHAYRSSPTDLFRYNQR